MSERTPKQPLNDPEYTVPEYSVLLPSDEAKNSTAEGDSAPNNTASANAALSGAVDNNAAEDNAPASEQVIPECPKAMRNVMWCATAMIVLSVLSSSLWILLPIQSYTDFERAMVTLFLSIIPIFVLWKIWEGREWARVITSSTVL